MGPTFIVICRAGGHALVLYDGTDRADAQAAYETARASPGRMENATREVDVDSVYLLTAERVYHRASSVQS